MKKINVLCLTYGKLKQLMKTATEKITDPDLNIDIMDGIKDELYDGISERIASGADIIVAGGANAEYAKDTFDLPVMQIEITPFDYVKALITAKTMGEKICIVKYRDDNFYDFEKISSMLNISFKLVVYEDTLDMEAQLTAFRPQVIIGGGNANAFADKLGCQSLLIYPGEEAIMDAIQKSKSFFIELKQERERSNLLKTLLYSIPNAIIIVDERGNIIEFNTEAENFFDVTKNRIKNHHIKEVLPESKLEDALYPDFTKNTSVKSINGKMFLDTQIQLRADQIITGAISLVAEMSNFTNAAFEYQLKQEKKNKIKGFTAKNHFEDIIGNSKALQKAISESKIYARSDSGLLLTGETGCGKELFAQSVHNFSDRCNEPFLAINCAALPENLLESELFGYEEGAFTGSRKGGKMGIFELAGRGTIFLDEIGELPLALQSRLLRVLQEMEVLRIGGDRLYKINARIISATNRDIHKLDNLLFRRDLLFRLNVLEVKIPPLRERTDDVLPLFRYFLAQRTHFTDKEMPLSPAVSELLLRYSWPGNIRELQNVCERFYLFMEQSKRWDEKTAHKNIMQAIGEEQIISDIIRQHGYQHLSDIDSKNLKIIFRDLKALLHLSNEVLSGKLGISRTTAWRMENSQ